MWPIDGTLTDHTIPDENRLRSNGNEGVLHTSQIFRTEDSLSDAV